ncbi:MAG: RagB/SusD family nutrient uptake outer membrane protein [Opitutaceae bacterium]|nr:RagB/SusD family nutrient uptake outer membrane protein [Cytophagales bacterium]
MKYLIYIILAGAILITTVSCKKFLKEKPEGFIRTDEFYNTESDALNALSATYYLLNAGGNTVQTPYNTLFNTGLNFMCDDEFPGPGATNPDVRSMAVLLHNSTNLRVYELWQQHYAAVRKANLVLEKVPSIAMNVDLKNRILAEAKFLRALYYFNLVRLFGDIPLVLEPQYGISSTDYVVDETPSVKVYEQIERDLREASRVLPVTYASPNVGRATKGAALALLSKVYLTKASHPLNLTSFYQDAVATADSIILNIGKYGYDLQPNYANVFLPQFKNNSEHIFSAQFKSATGTTYQTQGNFQNSRSIKTSVPGISGLYADQVWFYNQADPSKPDGVDHFFSVFKLYKPIDKRRDVTFVTGYLAANPNTGKKQIYGALNNPQIKGSNLDSVPYFNKTWDPSSTAITSESAANVAIIRYAELLLIQAEAENELNGPSAKAYNSLNKVRGRAGLPDLGQGLSQSQFRDSLYLDRRLELVFEYHRWFDLVRQKDASGANIFVKTLQAVGKINAQEIHRLHPIPQNEIQLNPKLTQNPGY